MILTLVPMFLAANLTANIHDWKYGPEAIYNVRVDIGKVGNDGSRESLTDMTFPLRCRYHDDSMDCHFKRDDVLENFRLNYDRHGLKDIIVDSTVNPSRVNEIRDLVGLLTVGTDLTRMAPKRHSYENEISPVGLCGTAFEVTTVTRKPVNSDFNPSPYVLVSALSLFEPEFDPEKELLHIELRKRRDVKACRQHTGYFKGSSSSGESSIKLLLSRSSMTTTSKRFISFNENEILVRNAEGVKRINTKITLYLEDIVPAPGPPIRINDPTRTNIFVALPSDSSEESSEDESSQSVDYLHR